MIKRMRNPVSSLTHMSFAVLAIPVTAVLVALSVMKGSVTGIVSFAVFGLALFLLYSASAVYHALNVRQSTELILKKIDHMMIFVLIAGTYTPICLKVLDLAWGVSILSVIWVLAIGGIVMKALWIGAPRWLYTTVYVVMGWIIVIASYPLNETLPLPGFITLLGGGLFYTVGALFYALKWPRKNAKHFGFHEIFHLLIMCGTAAHVVFMFLWVL